MKKSLVVNVVVAQLQEWSKAQNSYINNQNYLQMTISCM